MRQELTFKLNDPSFEKFEIWKGLGASINKLCAEQGLIIESRTYDEKNYTQTVVSNAPDRNTIFLCTHDTIVLLVEHGISTTCTIATQNDSPEMHHLRINLKLTKRQRNNKYFNLWIKVAKTIDAECRRFNVYVERTLNAEDFSMHLSVKFMNQYDWAYLSYFAGNACGKAGIELMHYESFVDPNCEDILDQITHVTGKHKQLSFLPKLKQA